MRFGLQRQNFKILYCLILSILAVAFSVFGKSIRWQQTQSSDRKIIVESIDPDLNAKVLARIIELQKFLTPLIELPSLPSHRLLVRLEKEPLPHLINTPNSFNDIKSNLIPL